MSETNGIFKTPNLLLLDIDRPLPFGIRLRYRIPTGEIKMGVVVEGGYYSLIIWDGTNVHIILYNQLVSVG